MRQADLDYMTPKSTDFVTIHVKNNRGSQTAIKINKYKTFRCLMSILRLRLYKRIAKKEGKQVDEIARKLKANHEFYSIKFNFSDSELLENEKILTIGDGTVINQTIRYIGG